MMKVLHLSKLLDTGGAAIAAFNIHLSLQSVGIKSDFAIDEVRLTDTSNAAKVVTPGVIYINKYISFVRRKLSNFPLIFSTLKNQRSCNILPTPWPRIINNSDCDVVVIHWIGGGGISIFDLLKINKKIIWILHDMWIFCGSEHLGKRDRYVNGYTKLNKPIDNVLLDVDRLIWLIKKHAIGKIKDITFVAPSDWMKGQAEHSKILFNRSIRTINIPIDIDYWCQNFNSSLLRRSMVPKFSDKVIITFGCSSASSDKGMLLFIEAIELLPQSVKNMICLVFFGVTSELPSDRISIPFINYAFVASKSKMRDIFRISDICVYPSKIESFGQLAAESIACGTPVVAYRYSGVSDFITNNLNGFLFQEYTAPCLMESIQNAFLYNQDGKFVNLAGSISKLNLTDIGIKYKNLICEL